MVNERAQRQTDRLLDEAGITVVFRGDGEPLSPGLLVRQLGSMDSYAGMDTDTYSLGGTVEELERRFAEDLGKEENRPDPAMDQAGKNPPDRPALPVVHDLGDNPALCGFRAPDQGAERQ